MINNNHPITPPSKLLQQWWDDTHGASYEFDAVATQAARWGADQELEACCKLLELSDSNARDFLYSARRPKPPSLKQQALALLDDASDRLDAAHENTIRHAIESLPD